VEKELAEKEYKKMTYLRLAETKLILALESINRLLKVVEMFQTLNLSQFWHFSLNLKMNKLNRSNKNDINLSKNDYFKFRVWNAAITIFTGAIKKATFPIIQNFGISFIFFMIEEAQLTKSQALIESIKMRVSDQRRLFFLCAILGVWWNRGICARPPVLFVRDKTIRLE